MVRGPIRAGASLAIFAAAVAGPAEAATPRVSGPPAGGDVLSEITVTAARRESNLQTTPVTVSAIDGSALQANVASRLEQIADFVPNLYLTDGVANQSTLAVNLRGHGEAAGGVATSESPVAFYVDDVYQARLSAANIELVDVERIEVLRGPQGTLFGRNSMAGAVNVVLHRPTDTAEARVVASVGNYDEYKVKGMVSGPVASGLSGAVAAVYADRGRGYKHNVATAQRADTASLNGVRGSLRADVGEWQLRATAHWSDADNDGFVPTGLDPRTLQPLYGDIYTVSLPAPSIGRTTHRGGAVHVDGPVGGVQGRIVSAYSEVDDEFRFDISGGIRAPTGAFVPGYDRASLSAQSQWSHEFQLRSETGSPVQWIGGLFYFTEDVWQTVGNRIYSPATGAIVTGPETTYRGTTESYAAYGQVDWPFATHWTLTLGGRYTREDKSIAGTIGTAPFANTTDYSSFNPKLGVSFAAADNVFLYASVSTGFRAGGFNGFGGTIPAVSTPFGAEKVRAYEVGAKTTWLDRRARLNAAVYRNDYRDLQSNAPNANGTFVTQNALDVRDSGVELEFTGRLTDALELTIAAGYQHQDFLMIRPGTVFATSGARHTTNVAPYSGAVGMNYRVPAGVRGADFRAAANLVLRGTSYASNDNNAVSENSKLSRVNASIGFVSADDVWSITLSGRNLTNQEDWSNGIDLRAFLGTGIRQAMEPRTWSLEFGYRYGN
jgi:iron complex outermembrane receptor protein